MGKHVARTNATRKRLVYSTRVNKHSRAFDFTRHGSRGLGFESLMVEDYRFLDSVPTQFCCPTSDPVALTVPRSVSMLDSTVRAELIKFFPHPISDVHMVPMFMALLARTLIAQGYARLEQSAPSELADLYLHRHIYGVLVYNLSNAESAYLLNNVVRAFFSPEVHARVFEGMSLAENPMEVFFLGYRDTCGCDEYSIAAFIEAVASLGLVNGYFAGSSMSWFNVEYAIDQLWCNRSTNLPLSVIAFSAIGSTCPTRGWQLWRIITRDVPISVQKKVREVMQPEIESSGLPSFDLCRQALVQRPHLMRMLADALEENQGLQALFNVSAENWHGASSPMTLIQKPSNAPVLGKQTGPLSPADSVSSDTTETASGLAKWHAARSVPGQSLRPGIGASPNPAEATSKPSTELCSNQVNFVRGVSPLAPGCLPLPPMPPLPACKVQPVPQMQQQHKQQQQQPEQNPLLNEQLPSQQEAMDWLSEFDQGLNGLDLPYVNKAIRAIDCKCPGCPHGNRCFASAIIASLPPPFKHYFVRLTRFAYHHGFGESSHNTFVPTAVKFRKGPPPRRHDVRKCWLPPPVQPLGAEALSTQHLPERLLEHKHVPAQPDTISDCNDPGSTDPRLRVLQGAVATSQSSIKPCPNQVPSPSKGKALPSQEPQPSKKVVPPTSRRRRVMTSSTTTSDDDPDYSTSMASSPPLFVK